MCVTATFHDLQELDNTLNGTAVSSAATVVGLLGSLRNREPFIFELRGDNGVSLTVGLARDIGCVQYASSDGSPPYRVARNKSEEDTGESVCFLMGDQQTEISRRYCLAYEEVSNVAVHFVLTGNKTEAVEWEEI